MAIIMVWCFTWINSRTILLNIFLCDLFYFLAGTDTNHADNTTLYNGNLTQKLAINKLEESFFFSNGLITAI